jgi:hypothetical protein
MRRREFIALMGASVTWPFAAMAQVPGRTYRVGGLSAIPRNSPLFGWQAAGNTVPVESFAQYSCESRGFAQVAGRGAEFT